MYIYVGVTMDARSTVTNNNQLISSSGVAGEWLL